MENETDIVFDRRIWLSSPTMHGLELDYMKEAYDTNWMSTIGENINQIEKIITDKLNCKFAVALSSGTAALHLAIKSAGIKRGDKVFCSDMTFSATVNPVVYEGGEPIFIDTEYDTWNMDPVALEKAFELYPDVKFVILVHLYGVPAKLDEIKSICEKHNAILIEDSAEALGATYKGKPIGTENNFNILSFNGNKIITGTSGGMFLTNDEKLANKVKKWSTQSREDTIWYQHHEIGYNYRMSNVVADVVRGQLPYLEEHIAQKTEIYKRYKEGLKGLPLKMNPFDKEKSVPNFWLSCIIIDNEAMCEQNIGDLEADYIKKSGKSCPIEILNTLRTYVVESRPIWKPMHMQPIYKDKVFITKNGLYDGSVDVGRDIFHRGLCLPSDNKMTKEEQDKIIKIIRNCFK